MRRMTVTVCLAGILTGSSAMTDAAAPPDLEENLSGGVTEGSVLKIDPDELVILSDDGREIRLQINNVTKWDPDIEQGDIVEVVVTPSGLTTSVEFLRHGVLTPELEEE